MLSLLVFALAVGNALATPLPSDDKAVCKGKYTDPNKCVWATRCYNTLAHGESAYYGGQAATLDDCIDMCGSTNHTGGCDAVTYYPPYQQCSFVQNFLYFGPNNFGYEGARLDHCPRP